MKELFIKRDILEDLRYDLSKKEIAFLVGPRQSGKTTSLSKFKYREFSQPLIPPSFHCIAEKHKPERCMVVNKNLKTKVNFKGSEISFLTIWDLLQEEI
jgi:ABC-type hemin transport system ATPase subunit